jgi:hypothetical protein
MQSSPERLDALPGGIIAAVTPNGNHPRAKQAPRSSNSHFGPSGCHIVMAGLVPAIHRGTVLRGWPEQVRP